MVSWDPTPAVFPLHPRFQDRQVRQYIIPGIAPFSALVLVAEPIAVGAEYLVRYPEARFVAGARVINLLSGSLRRKQATNSTVGANNNKPFSGIHKSTDEIWYLTLWIRPYVPKGRRGWDGASAIRIGPFPLIGGQLGKAVSYRRRAGGLT